MNADIIVESRDLHVQFGGVKAADGVNLALYRGQIAAIIGPNGSGKSTFLNLCTGYVRPTSGSVTYAGKDLTRLAPRRISRLGVARSFQLPQLFTEHTVEENILIALAARDRFWTLSGLHNARAIREADALLEMFQLRGQARRPMRTLPEGIRKLVDIAVALAQSPEVLLMDEPTSGVSSSEKFAIMDLLIPVLRERGITALLVEHDMELVERYMDRVIVWNAGRVAADGSPGEVMRSEEVMRDVVGAL